MIAPEALWNQERRETYLLRPELPIPMSLDDWGWPSVLDDVWEKMPGWLGHNMPLWEELDQLQTVLSSEVCDSVDPYWLVAFTVMVDAKSIDRIRETEYKSVGDNEAPPRLFPTKPPDIQHGWTFLGYDVADGSISGLSNCGYTEEDDPPKLRREWGPKLNGYGLLMDLQDAVEFTAFTDERVKEHAPFFIYGIWLIEKVEGMRG